jgi:CheY-like chemotaxis protein
MRREVLLVDDEEVFRFINEQVIRQTGIQCEVSSVSNGEEALQLINRCLDAKIATPDFIFLDLNMPIMDGYQFIQLFQNIKFGSKPKPTIVILTSSLDERDRRRVRELGIEYFISKPLKGSDVKKIFDL